MTLTHRIAVLAVGCVSVLVAGTSCERSQDPTVPIAVSVEDADPDLAARLKDLLAATRGAPQSGELRGRLAMAYEMNGFPDAALGTYAQAESLDPGEFSWPYFRALLLAKNGDLPAALDQLDRAIGLDADYVPAWLWRGKWSLDSGDDAEAEASYRRAEALGAGSPAVAGLAQVRMRAGQYSQALALLEPVANEQRHPHLYRMLGEAYRELGRGEDARVASARGRHATSLQWFDPRQGVKTEYIAGFKNQMAHAQDLLSVGRYEDALEILEPWRERYPEDAALLTNLGWAYMSLGDLDQAQAIMERGLAEHSDDTPGYYFHYHLGRLHAMRGEVADALDHLATASALNPTQSEPHLERANLLLRLGRRDEALAAFEKAMEVGTRFPEQTLQTMGVIEAARGRWQEAIGYFREAVREDPSFAMAYVQLGRSLGQEGRWGEAREALATADRLGTHPRDVAAARRVLAALEAGADPNAEVAEASPDGA